MSKQSEDSLREIVRNAPFGSWERRMALMIESARLEQDMWKPTERFCYLVVAMLIGSAVYVWWPL